MPFQCIDNKRQVSGVTLACTPPPPPTQMEQDIQRCRDAVHELLQLLPRAGRGKAATILSLLEQAIYLAGEEDSQVTDPLVGEEVCLEITSTEVGPEESALCTMDTGSLPPDSTPVGSQEEDVVPGSHSRVTTTDGSGQVPPPKRKRALRSEGGFRRMYSVDPRGFTSYVEEMWGPCPLTHVSAQNPKSMVQYATGEDGDKFVGLASHCLMADKFEPPRSILTEVAALLRLSEVNNPSATQPPADLSEEGLSTWSCAEHLEHLLGLIHLPLAIRVLADYHVGKYLNFLRGMEGAQTLAVLGKLCTEASRRETGEYLGLLRECSCRACRDDLEWVEDKSTSPRIGPCRTTQVKAKVLNERYKNCTPTYLSQCCSFARAVHHSHPLLHQRHVAPSRVRQLAPELKRELEAMQRRGVHPSKSYARLGQGEVFMLDQATALQAVDYVDGDGGYLVANLIPGLEDFLAGLGVPTLEVFRDRRDTLVAFREMYHDAVELDHVYRRHVSRSPRSLGVESLRLARANIATSQMVYICCDRRVDFYRKRLLVEVLLLRDNKLRSNGEVMLSEGLSVPLNDSPVSYRSAQTEAEQHQAGVYGVFPPEVANMACMKPEALRVQFPEPVVHEGEMYSVTGNSPLRNESHVLVRESSIPGAGNGLFLRARAPSRHPGQARHDVFVQANTHLCVYSDEMITSDEYDRLANVDYVMQNRRGIFNPETFNGTNIGRFVNQGGLIPAFKKMVAVSSKLTHPGGPDWRAVESTADEYCTVKYSYRQNLGGLCVELKRETHLTDSSQELLANYSIRGYWVPYFAGKVRELGTSDDCVGAVLWCACSCGSNWSDEDKRLVCSNLQASGLTPADYANVLCPWDIAATSTTAATRLCSGLR